MNGGAHAAHGLRCRTAQKSARTPLRTYVDASLQHGNFGAVTFLVDFAAFMAIGLLVDRAAFSEMRRTASSFWPTKGTTYKATLFPRIAPLPIGAALSAYAPGPDMNAVSLTGLALMVMPVLLLCVAIFVDGMRPDRDGKPSRRTSANTHL